MKVLTFGRSSENDVSINDILVSRHHLQIIQDEQGRFRLADFGSKNGTYVNGRRVVGEISLSPNDVVRIGNTTLAWKNHFGHSDARHTPSSPRSLPVQPPQPIIVQPAPLIPENININKNEKVEYSNVLRKGDDFKVNFNRNMGNQIGSTVGGTLGCLLSIIIIVVVIFLITRFV